MLRILSILMALSVLLTGCQGREQTENEVSGVQQEESMQSESAAAEQSEPEQSAIGQEVMYPGEGGRLSLAIQNPVSLLPWQVTDEATGKMLMLIYNSLMNPNAEGEMQPCLAESWSWSEDLRELTVQLRPEVYFHDGQSLTASDVVYSVQMLKSSGNVFQSAVAGIEQAEVLDESRVLLRFSAPGRMNEEALVFPIVPWGYEDALKPVGTGPYAYAGGETMREMSLKRYDGYFGDRPYVTDVTVYFVRDAAAVEQCFATTRTNLMQMDQFSWGAYVNQKDLTIHRFESYEALYLEFNTETSFGRSLSNRQKVAYGIDAVRVLRDAYWGKGNVTETLLRPTSWYQGHTTKEYGYDAEKALNMAAEGTSQVRLLYDGKDFVQVAAAETIQQQLEAAGLTVVLVTSGSYDVALKRGRMTLMAVAKKLGQAELLAEAGSEEAVREAASQLDEQMSRDLKVYNLFFLTQGTVTGFGIKGELTPCDWNVFLDIEDLYMKGTTGK